MYIYFEQTLNIFLFCENHFQKERNNIGNVNRSLKRKKINGYFTENVSH